jgi:DNA polymerase, archaea type
MNLKLISLKQVEAFLATKKRTFKDLEELPENTPAILLSAIYVGEEQKIYLKFYDLQRHIICFWRDRTNHKPYCYTKMDYLEQLRKIVESDRKFKLEQTKKIELIKDKEIDVVKIIAPDPLSIGGTDNSIREKITSWEADIKYHENYLYDTGLIPGAYYVRRGEIIDKFEHQISEKVQLELKSLLWDKINEQAGGTDSPQYRQYLTDWANLLNQPIPNLRRLAVDIEVESEEGRMPTPRDHDRKIIAIGFAGTDGYRKVLVLDENGDISGIPFIQEVEICKTEKELLKRAFGIIGSYPILVTYNGDDFDLPYLYARSQDQRIDPAAKQPISKDEIPIIVKKDTFVKRGIQAEPIQTKNGLHLDLFRTFQNKSVQIYAFSHKYSEFTLKAVCEALLNDTKLEFEGDISGLPKQTLAQYCLKDAELTLRLTTFNDNLLIKLLVVICRISRLSLEDISRFGVNQWIRGILYFEHRKRRALIPRRAELQEKGSASTSAIIKEKKYRGGLVVEPVLGIHFNVIVVDFASLYPSIIKVHNLSYETVNCPHLSCKNDPKQHIQNTTHWICKEKRGITSLLIGSLRDLRVNYYKYLSKEKSLALEEQQLYGVVSQAIKVILNAAYGVMGAEIFPLYCLPVADATATIGRSITANAIEKCKQVGIEVVYGDTDSLFLKNPSDKRVDEVSTWARTTLGVDLEMDKHYRYVVFSALKKNYLGVLVDGTVDVKGLTGKKSHTPPFIRKAFYEILNILSKVNSESDFESAKQMIKHIIQENASNLEQRRIPLEDLTFNVMINKSPGKYGKTVGNGQRMSLDGRDPKPTVYKGLPQHIKAARFLVDLGRDLKAGDIVSYVKTKTGEGVKPLELATPQEIDTQKYIDAMEATLDQVLSSLNFQFKSLLGRPRQSNLDDLFWGS